LYDVSGLIASVIAWLVTPGWNVSVPDCPT